MTRIHIWPVIHVLDAGQAVANAKIAAEAGVEGVFLIQMQGWDEIIDPAARLIRQALPGFRIGVNYLSMAALDALQHSMDQGWDATWSDSPGVRSDEISEQAKAIGALLLTHPDHLYFGSVAFKYQTVDHHPGEAARAAQALGMIPTTSGEATGSAPSSEKLAKIRSVLGAGRLAVASGVTPENIKILGPHLTHALVATGIGQDFYHFCPNKLRELVEAAKTC